jgi:hypothetical protein
VIRAPRGQDDENVSDLDAFRRRRAAGV